MRVLVTAGTKHGSTTEIRDAIADTLRKRGLDTMALSPDDVRHVEEFDAVVLGSAVYAGHWVKPAKELVERAREGLAGKRVWLFSSGPVGHPPKPDEEPVDVAEIIEATGALEHRLFPGKLDKSRLNFGERALVAALRAPEGDFRDWVAQFARDNRELF